MSTSWATLNARAAGLATRLLSPAQIELLAQQPTVASFAQLLAQLQAAELPAELTPPALELALRRTAAARLRALVRWQPESLALMVLELDEDLRSIRQIIRGMIAGLSPAHRVANLVATRMLPERALRQLAELPDLQRVGTLLSAWRHPLAAAFAARPSREIPDAAHAELALQHAYARRALAGTRGSGHEFQHYVRESIDVINTTTAITLATGGADIDAAECFLPGGIHVSANTFSQAARAGNAEAAAMLLAPAFEGTRIANVLRTTRATRDLELRLTVARAATLRRRARVAPLSCAPTLLYMLRVRLELVNLLRVLWGVVLNTPGLLISEGLVVV
jgi:vacuolar-type H+-ATPase subunit C/Vma6